MNLKRLYSLELQSIKFSTISVYIFSWKSHWLSSNLVNLIEKIFRKKSGCGGHPWLVRTQSRMRCGLALATKNFRFRSRPDRGKGHDHFICSITFWLLDVQLKKKTQTTRYQRQAWFWRVCMADASWTAYTSKWILKILRKLYPLITRQGSKSFFLTYLVLWHVILLKLKCYVDFWV